MQNDVNVVHFKALGESSSRLPAVLLPVRDRAAQRLNTSLQQLFDNADDALFEMADRAGSNQEQSLYFEAMRDLRLRRKSIERSFLQQYFERFAALNNLVGSKPEMRLDSVSYEDLSLVQNDALEESVAVDTMVAKALSNNAMAISHLTIRFNTQLSSKLDDATHPLGPRRLCEAFVEACRDLDTDIKVKLIIYKLFERFVLNGLGQLYAESNRQLVDAGVLPQLKAIPQQVPSRSSKGYSGRTPAHVNSEDDGQELFGTLQGLLAQLRSPGSATLGGGRSSDEGAASGDGQVITSYDLMRLLSHLQQQISSQSLDGYDLKAQLGVALGRISERSGRKRVVGQVDEDVINLVAMLFEFILDDLTLPDSLKALIARLQIPMLKVAVLDKTFFSRGSHPARRLLNEIAAASLGWGEQSDLQRDGLYQKIEQIVQRLLSDFVDDPEIFAELLADFMAYVSDEQRRSELLEQRTRDAEEGRARAEIARLQVEHVLSQRLQEHQLPGAVQRVLREAWSQVLLLTCLKQGYDSSEWRAALKTMDDLIWSIQPHHDVASRQRLLEMVPGLLKALREGLASAAFDPFSTSEFFTELESLHVQTFQQTRPELAEASATPDVVAAAPTPVPADEPFELPRAGERIAGLTAESLEWVDNLSVGAWLEILDVEQKLRCKLAAVIRPMGRLVFVNRTGMKVLDRTREELALDYQEGRVRLLDDALLFDRAMTSVIGNLRGQSPS